MKISKILYKLVTLVMIVILINPCMCYANNHNRPDNNINRYEDGGGGTSSTNSTTEDNETVEGNSTTGLPTLNDSYRPSVAMGAASDIISKILSALTVLGVVAVVIGIALIGFGSILGSASQKADAQTKMVGIVIAGILITSGSIIAKFIISVAESI